ncbi:hypothetical protein HB847_04250, partial [Listeria booriae]
MINKKRVNKVTKLTVASAIAFSALAQPLGTLVTVKAAEAPVTTKAENKLLQSTIINESSNKNLKSNLNASKVLLQNPNLVFDTSSMTVTGWGFGYRNGNSDTLPFRNDVPPFSPLDNGWYSTSLDDVYHRNIRVSNSNPGLGVATTFSAGHPIYLSLYQNVKTTPGAEYTFGYTLEAAETIYQAAIKVVDKTETIIASTPLGVQTTPGTRNYSTTFTARSTETRVEIVLAGNPNVGTAKGFGGKLVSAFLTPTDTTPPDAPIVTPVYNTDTTIKGNGEANCDVTVTLESGDVATGTTDANGNFTIDIPAQAAGKRIKVTLTDGAGNESEATTVTVLARSIDKPTIDTVTTDTVDIEGTGIPGATVQLKIGDGNWSYEDHVYPSGKYYFTIPKQPFGTVISVKQMSNGATSDITTTTVVQGAVAAPTIDAVKSDDTSVKGTGIPGATVTVTIAGQDRTATVDSEGKYVVEIPAQAAGTEITAKQTLNGVTSNPVSTTVTQGTVAAPTIDNVTTDDEKVTGTGINGATVTVKVGNQDYTATVENNRYSIDIAKQPVGTVITAKQTLNGETSSSVETTVTQGTVAAPTISEVTTDDEIVKGTGITGATVTVKVGGQDYPATVTDGKYSVTIPKQVFGTEITATQTLNGKTSSEAKITVTQGTVAPPTINPVTTDDEKVTGTGINGATVTVMIGNQEYPATVTNNEYSVVVPKQPSGTIISAKQTLNGKTSDIATTTVGQGTVAAPTINSLTSDDVMARGTGISGAVVTITIGTDTYTGTVINGNYAIEIPKQAAGTVVYAKQTLFGQTSNDAQTTVTQGSVSAPTINTVTTESTTVTGSGINGATVTVKIGNQEYPATVTNGTYSVTIEKQPFGTEITAKQSLNGQTSSEVSTTVTQGTISAPTINTVTTDSTTVTGSGINGATVTVKIGSQEYPATVTNGTYSVTIEKQPFGTEI